MAINFIPMELIDVLDDRDHTSLLLALLYKREYDGLNGRVWDASKHLIWEERICKIIDENIGR